MEKLFRCIFCTILLIVLFTSGFFYVDAADSVTEFNIAVTGDKIPDTELYASTATIALQPQNDFKDLVAYINYDGIWMKLPDRQKNVYYVSFSGDGNYSFQFRMEDSQTKASTIKEVDFTIDSQFAKLLNDVKALPNLNTSTDETVTKNKAVILSLKKRYNQLPADQRLLFPVYPKHILTTYYQWLANIEPSINYKEPESPVIAIKCALPVVNNIYSGPVTITVTPKNTWNLHAVWVKINDGWHTMQKGQNSEYTFTLTDEKSYHLDFCVQDQNNNTSESASADFMIHSAAYQIVSETERLYTQASTLSKDSYLAALESTYMQYLSASPLQQFQISTEITNRLETMYSNALSMYNISNIAYDEKGNFLKAYGMLTRLNTAPGTPNLKLSADRVNRVLFGQVKPKQNIKAEYNIAFFSAEGEPVSYQIENNAPILISIQVPEDLKGKKNVDLLVMKDGEYVSTGAKVRSTKDGLVLLFRTFQTGSYAFVCD